MIKHNEVDLASLYPTPKSYDEMETERVERKERNKPRHIPVKVGAYWTTFVTILIATYYLCGFIVRDSLVSALNVMVGICVALFVFILGLAILKYLYSRLRDLLYNLQVSAALYIGVFILTFVGIVCAIWLTDGSWAVILAVLVICFVATSLSVAILERRLS